MTDKDPANEHSEKLLDDIAARIRNVPIPDYPGPPVLDRRADRTPSFPRPAMVAVGCCLIVLCVAAIAVMNWDRPKETSHQAEQIAESDNKDDVEITDLIGRSNPTVGPIRIVPFDLAPEFERMTDGLDRISSRLDQLESEVAVLEVQSDLAFLLVQYTPHEYSDR